MIFEWNVDIAPVTDQYGRVDCGDPRQTTL